MAATTIGWLHGIFLSVYSFVLPHFGFTLSLFCDHHCWQSSPETSDLNLIEISHAQRICVGNAKVTTTDKGVCPSSRMIIYGAIVYWILD